VEHILIETGLDKSIAEYKNVGDISMLQVAVERLHTLFPDATLNVLTDSVEDLNRFCPAARPLDNRGRALWFENGVLLGKYCGLVPKWIVNLLVKIKRAARSRFPSLLAAVVTRRLELRNRPTDAKAILTFIRVLQRTDLLLICGAGGFYDGCQAWNLGILDLLDVAIQKHIPVAMLGQAFGPLTDPFILKRAAKVLPRVNFITLRGSRGSSDILRSLGVPESNFETTGDEALELAYESRPQDLGSSLGVNIRFLASACIDEDDVKSIRSVLQGFAKKHTIQLLPLPIAIHEWARDDLAIRQLLIGFDEQSDGGKTLDSPLKVIREAAHCRAVVTGAYHAAVFALAQGIPVIGLAKSAYFSSKFFGLKDLFGEGCETLLLNEPALPKRLEAALERAWENADRLRVPLQTAALRQIELSRRSYERIKALAESHTKRIASNADSEHHSQESA
jgi:polysaccharide pyruvyl transferase WcaK-like protein